MKLPFSAIVTEKQENLLPPKKAHLSATCRFKLEGGDSRSFFQSLNEVFIPQRFRSYHATFGSLRHVIFRHFFVLPYLSVSDSDNKKEFDQSNIEIMIVRMLKSSYHIIKFYYAMNMNII